MSSVSKNGRNWQRRKNEADQRRTRLNARAINGLPRYDSKGHRIDIAVLATSPVYERLRVKGIGDRGHNDIQHR